MRAPRITTVNVVRGFLVVMIALFFKLVLLAVWLWLAVVIVGGICLLITMLRFTFWRPYVKR